MKTISGKVVSTKPISLSDAAKSLTKFAASDQGASHSISFFIHKAAHSFNQLVHFHDRLRPNFTNNVPKVEEISQISHKSGVKVETLVKNQGFSNEERVDIGGVEREEFKKNGMEFGEIDGYGKMERGLEEVKEDGVVSSDKMKKKNKKHKGVGVGDGEVEDQKSINNVERVDIGKGHKEKSEKNEPTETEGEQVKDDDGMISRDKKKKKKKNRGVDENKGEVEKVKEDLVVNEDGERKKSKSVDRDASENDGSTEQSKKKKSKKRRIEGEN